MPLRRSQYTNTLAEPASFADNVCCFGVCPWCLRPRRIGVMRIGALAVRAFPLILPAIVAPTRRINAAGGARSCS